LPGLQLAVVGEHHGHAGGTTGPVAVSGGEVVDLVDVGHIENELGLAGLDVARGVGR
jgi:hypothetical protein